MNKNNQSQGKEQRNEYNISETNFIYSNNEQTVNKLRSVFRDPYEGSIMLLEIFQKLRLIKPDGALKSSVSIVAVFHALQSFGGIIYKHTSSKDFQRAVYYFFDTPFQEQKRQVGNNDLKYRRSLKAVRDYLKGEGVNKKFS